MKVELVSYTQPPPPKNGEKQESLIDMVAFCARVSNPANQHNTKTNDKLVRYLIDNHHWSPLEMVNICLEVETTRDIARQILRHRSFSFQEFSQRYASVNELQSKDKDDNRVSMVREARLQDTKNRQNSIEFKNGDELTNGNELIECWFERQRLITEICQSTYDWAISQGIAKEQARVVLPEGLTPSRLYINGTLRSWVHYIQLRSGNGTQKEHREVAIACADVIKPLFPMIMDFVKSE